MMHLNHLHHQSLLLGEAHRWRLIGADRARVAGKQYDAKSRAWYRRRAGEAFSLARNWFRAWRDLQAGNLT